MRGAAGRKRYEFAVGEQVIATEYDSMGNAVAQTDALGSESRTVFDHAGRAVRNIRLVAGKEQIAQTVYDTLGNKAQAIDPAGGTTDFTYDALGRLLRKTADFGVTK